jgi:hypothetical protein
MSSRSDIHHNSVLAHELKQGLLEILDDGSGAFGGHAFAFRECLSARLQVEFADHVDVVRIYALAPHHRA